MYKDNTGSKSKKTSMSCHKGSLDLVEDKLVLGLFSKVSFFLISFDLVEDKLVLRLFSKLSLLRLFSKLSSLAYLKKYLLFCFSFCPSKIFVLFFIILLLFVLSSSYNIGAAHTITWLSYFLLLFLHHFLLLFFLLHFSASCTRGRTD